MDKKARIATVVALVAMMVLAASAVSAGRWTRACNDGVDNDGDGFVDYPDDSGCRKWWDRTETNPNIECDDGLDNDGDSLVDMQDPGCESITDNDETDGTQIPNSCSDTDGGNVISIAGTTSGYLNNQPYSNDDYCVDGSNIMEFFCVADYESSQEQSCGEDYISDPYCIENVVWQDDVLVFCGLGECDESAMPMFIEICNTTCLNGTCV